MIQNLPHRSLPSGDPHSELMANPGVGGRGVAPAMQRVRGDARIDAHPVHLEIEDVVVSSLVREKKLHGTIPRGGINQGRPTWEENELTTPNVIHCKMLVSIDMKSCRPLVTPLRTVRIADPNQ
jgi:hypothetical protein